MGRKKNKLLRKLKQELQDRAFNPDPEEEAGFPRLSGKQLSKRHKKIKKLSRKQQVTITKEHRWYLVKVFDDPLPTREFLKESFKTLVDTEFVIQGYHHATSSARFFLEDSSCAAMAIKGLNKRMQGSSGRLMQIQVEPCSSFIILNAQQMLTVKEVLMKRYDPTRNFLDLSSFHLDPMLVNEGVMPVLSDPAIFRQVLVVVRDNIPGLTTMSLGNNRLRLTNIRVVKGTLGNRCPLQRLNLESNDIDNFKELICTLAVFKLQELKLDGNPCLKDIKNPDIYIRTVLSQLPQLKTLDGQDIASHISGQTSSGDMISSLNTSLASTSLVSADPPPVPVNEPLVQKFLSEYYNCIDSDHREQLVNAYLPTAKFGIESHIAAVPSGTCEGSHHILEALKRMPAFKHAKETFSMKVHKLMNDLAEIEVSGQLQVAGHPDAVSFVHTLTVVPYNAGLGITLGIMGFK
ncbi:nuclear RNA export factor 1 [Hyalella azteca]|uniref:Nuclear RNA export factor 1 n=1 Tax=Hyalella azteca TaxID=294128 RepID=A0A8B7NM82_HYAAZ|nr:nuclear RNA export factor 1 [Hyalella azteca]